MHPTRASSNIPETSVSLLKEKRCACRIAGREPCTNLSSLNQLITKRIAGYVQQEIQEGVGRAQFHYAEAMAV